MLSTDITSALGADVQSGGKLEFVAKTKNTTLLKRADGSIFEPSQEEYRRLIAAGYACRPDGGDVIGFMPDEHARIKQSMMLHAIRRDGELRRAGNSAKRSSELVGSELIEDDRYRRYVPSQFALRTLQNWKKAVFNCREVSATPKNP